MLGSIWEGTEKKDFAANYYAQIVRNYPLSPLVPDAKGRLKALGAPVPQPDPRAVAWMTAEQNAPRPRTSLARKPLGFFKPGPGQELQVASRVGKPTMEPESDTSSGTDILTGGDQTRKTGTGTGIVATVTPGASNGTAGTAENVAVPADGSAPSSEAPADPNTSPAAADSANGGSTEAAGAVEGAPKADAAAAGTAQPGDDAANAAAAPAQDSAQNGTKDDKKKESTSKKKKGLRKIVPW
jgi:outer membrane protein assembly factor BamD